MLWKHPCSLWAATSQAKAYTVRAVISQLPPGTARPPALRDRRDTGSIFKGLQFQFSKLGEELREEQTFPSLYVL